MSGIEIIVGLIVFFGNFALLYFLHTSYENGWSLFSERKTIVGKILAGLFYGCMFILNVFCALTAFVFVASVIGLG